MSQPRYCSFCRTPKTECGILIAGPEATICGSCVAACVATIANPTKREAPKAKKVDTLADLGHPGSPLIVRP